MAEKRGKDWSDSDLDDLSAVSPADLPEAEAQWDADMAKNDKTRWARGLLSAETDEEA